MLSHRLSKSYDRIQKYELDLLNKRQTGATVSKTQATTYNEPT